ncbi:hypothetical protein DERP_001712 [Dermatophagoides pteronyssinus]|uniref:Uncharacterized protein n=1 Tax=Dermatophagoides pteronyssinus TaxID=6956 RepID=A0ABQ8JBA3_DERPT|nr:hypothetical protein DERP_001712 [Dermatophagoides pteronyssinus]
MTSMIGDILRGGNDIIRMFVLDLIPVIIRNKSIAKKIQDVLQTEWNAFITFIFMLPLQIIYFLWFLSGGPLMTFSFLTRYFTYMQVAINIFVMAFLRTLLSITLLDDSNPISNIKKIISNTETSLSKSLSKSKQISTSLSSDTENSTTPIILKKETSKTKKN